MVRSETRARKKKSIKKQKSLSFRPKAIAFFLLFITSIVLSVGINAYILEKSYITFLITFVIWFIGTMYIIKYFNSSTIKEINQREGR